MFAIALEDEKQRLETRLHAKLARLKAPAKIFLAKALRVAYPLVLVSLTIFVASFGAYRSAVLALIAATILIVCGFTPGKRGKRRAEMTAACAFCLSVAFGLPTALYNFSTEPCLGAARLESGDVHSLNDPRLDDSERYWVQRASERLAAYWPAQGLPPLDATALANIVVQAKGLVQEIAWRGREPLTSLGLSEAKHAYAALHFDRRQVCYLYGAGERAHGLYFASGEMHAIADETDRAMALILPALQATYVAPKLPSYAADNARAVTAAGGQTTGFN
jgi:hypothetical protein